MGDDIINKGLICKVRKTTLLQDKTLTKPLALRIDLSPAVDC